MNVYTREMIKRLIPRPILRFLWERRANKKYLNGVKPKKSLGFEIHLTDHCNLNCSGCSHFSPLVKEAFLDVDEFERDCERIAELSGGELEWIHFCGGEPLLHKRIADILKIGRKHFPKASLEIVTNGILLPKETEQFWKICGENGVQILVSKYPIKINRRDINRLARKHNVRIIYGRGGGGSQWYAMKLDENGGQGMEDSFRYCEWSNECVNLYKGKLYTCSTIPYITYLNEYFGKKFIVGENDRIDIYKAKDMGEILRFLSTPAPFCRYCDKAGLRRNRKLEWGVSKKDINEWI